MNECVRDVLIRFYSEPMALRMERWQRQKLEGFLDDFETVRIGTVRKLAASFMLYEIDPTLSDPAKNQLAPR